MYTLPADAVASSIIFNQYLDTGKDIVVSFDYACYGTEATGSEGFCVFFTNTFAPNIVGGGPGPGLGYSSVSNISAAGATEFIGVGLGVVGVGFDITGNYGSDRFFSSGYSDLQPNTIALRADDGNFYGIITRTSNLNSLSAFNSPFSLYQQIPLGGTPTYKRVRVRLTDFGKRVVVDMKNIEDQYFTNYLNYSLDNYHSTPALIIPESIWCGLAFTTGEITNTTFKIKNFDINGKITNNTGTTPYIYTYDVDTTTLSATLTYLNPSNYLAYNDVLSAINVYSNDVNNPALTGRPLILVDPEKGPQGAPYSEKVQQPGTFIPDVYVKITKHR